MLNGEKKLRRFTSDRPVLRKRGEIDCRWVITTSSLLHLIYVISISMKTTNGFDNIYF